MTYTELLGNFSTDQEIERRVFDKSPYNWDINCRLNDLSSVAVLGLDIKITPLNEFKIIEVNGIGTGMEGFRESGVSFPGISGEDSCEEALIQHIHNLGKAPIVYLAARLKHLGTFPHRFENQELLKNPQFRDFSYGHVETIHPGWESRYGDFAGILNGIEVILGDKLCTDRFFENCRNLKSKTYEYNEDGLGKLIQDERPRFVVVKPYDGARGEGLDIFSADALREDRPAYSSDLVAESFIPSKPIFSEKDRKYHDGCMRYVVFAEEDKSGNVNFVHFGGYWRLCPNPISCSLDIDAMRANLAQGAIAAKASISDLSFIKETIDSQLPIFYKNMVNYIRK